MKAIRKASIAESQTDQRHTRAERDVLVLVDHPFVVKLVSHLSHLYLVSFTFYLLLQHYAFETRQRLFFVQEFCNGGELFRRMEVERLMAEDDAR